ncbi:ATP-binding cassette domain-containing protein [Clostridium hydrogeniformans]|uniref:ATP-binding cassette domain-containing protein n=1 Tax=Clostridium hydrogeniformans TaxID=349933 RepID=UPI00068DCADF|nr:ATP-binding cassette domain-containing protein [Clostridium hydrogeniformans]
MTSIYIKSLNKNYKSSKNIVKAVNNFSLTANRGEIIGLVGPNGAGKSTLVKLLCGILTPTDGDIEVLGLSPSKNRTTLSKDLGIMFGQRSSLWFNIPVKESLLLMKDIYEVPNDIFYKRLKTYAEKLNIENLLSTPVRNLSFGQKIRCEILATILHNPKLLILDEPTIGLDIVVKNSLRDIILDFSKENNSTVILTTHDIQDVEKLCSRVVFINKGEKQIDLTMSELKEILKKYSVIEIEKINGIDSFKNEFKQFYREETSSHMRFCIKQEDTKLFINTIINKFGEDIIFRKVDPNLEDILYAYYN